MFLDLIAHGGEVPMYCEREVIDLRCMIFNTMYRENIILKNRGKTALRCEVAELLDCAVVLVYHSMITCVNCSWRFPNSCNPTSSLYQTWVTSKGMRR